MNADRRPIHWLSDARDFARKAHSHASGETLDERQYLAIRYCLVVVGEALDFVPDDVLAAEPEIPWRKVIALRHRLVHAYWLIDEDIVSEIALNEIGPLVAALDRLIDSCS